MKQLYIFVIFQGCREPFQRPWQNPVPPLIEVATELVIKYPTDEEDNGIYAMAWRGTSVVTDLYTVTATNLLLKYLTEYAVSPLPKEFVEIDDPYASRVSLSFIIYTFVVIVREQNFKISIIPIQMI